MPSLATKLSDSKFWLSSLKKRPMRQPPVLEKQEEQEKKKEKVSEMIIALI